MEYLMSNVPKLRFKEFSGEWEEKSLEEMSDDTISYGIVQTGEDISDGIPCVRVIDLTANTIDVNNMIKTTKEISNSYKKTVLNGNEIMFALRGEIGLCKRVTKELIGANLTRGVARINPNTTIANSDYLIQCLHTSSAKNSIMQEVNGSALKEIPLNGLRKVAVYLPSKQEQEKIASFLTSVDSKIEQLTKKESLLSSYKKGVMQKIFSGEIRFKADDGSEFCEWEEKKIKELFIYKNGGSFESDVIEDGQYNLITLNSIDINGELKSEHKRVNINDNSLSKNDLIMVLSDVAHGNFLGLTAIIPEDNVYVLNQRMGALKPKTNNNISFIRFYINFNQKYFKLHGQGSSQQNLSKGDIEKFIVSLPCLEEQTKIANFLSSIDYKIEQVQKQLNSTKEFKKALLQQMFV